VSNLQFGEFVRRTGYTTDAERYGWSSVFAGLLPEAAKQIPTQRATKRTGRARRAGAGNLPMR